MVASDPLKLRIPPPFDLGATLESGQAHRWKRDGEWYSGVVYGNLLKVRRDPDGIEVYSSPGPAEDLVEMLSSYFRLR